MRTPAMKLPPQIQKFAIFLFAVSVTLGAFYLAIKGMQWLFVYMGSFGLNDPAPSLRIVGGIFLTAVVILRFYLRWRAKTARKKNEAKARN